MAEHMHAHRNCLRRRGVLVDSLDVAGKRHGIHEQAVDLAAAEAGDVAQLRRATKDFDGERVVRIGRLDPEPQPRAWIESRPAGGAVVVPEAGN